MSFALSLFRNNELMLKEKVDAFLEHMEDEDTRGLMITGETAKNIIQSAEIHAKDSGRIILDGSLCQKVALLFCKSDFLNDYNFTAVISKVVEQIFRVQSETDDSFSDNDLIQVFFDFFESRNCAGSVQLLTDYASQIIERYNKMQKKKATATDDLDFTTIDYKPENDMEEQQ